MISSPPPFCRYLLLKDFILFQAIFILFVHVHTIDCCWFINLILLLFAHINVCHTNYYAAFLYHIHIFTWNIFHHFCGSYVLQFDDHDDVREIIYKPQMQTAWKIAINYRKIFITHLMFKWNWKIYIVNKIIRL